MSLTRPLIGCAFLMTCAGSALAQEEDYEQGRYEIYRRAPGYGWRFDQAASRGPFSSPAFSLPEGEFRIQARYGIQDGSGLRDGTSNLSNADAFAERGYEYVPTDQRTDTMELELGYGLTEHLTLSMVVPYLDKQSDNVTSTGTSFRTSSQGVGDIQFWAHNKWYAWGSEQAFWSAGLEVPTGSFDETDARPGSATPAVLPYQMQLGSGTYDLTGLVGWNGYDDRWSWGGNFQQTWRLFGPNDRRYTLGSYRQLALWGGRQLTDSIIGTLRIQWSRQGDIKGSDPALSKSRSPSEHPQQQKVKRLDLLAGFNFYQGTGPLEGLRVGLEGGIPVFQKLRGPQIKTDYFAGIGLQWTF